MVRALRLRTLCSIVASVLMVALAASGSTVRAAAPPGSAASHSAPSASKVASGPSTPQNVSPAWLRSQQGVTFITCPTVPGKRNASPNAMCGFKGTPPKTFAPVGTAALPKVPMEPCPSIPGKPSSPGAMCGGFSAAGLQVLKHGYPQPPLGTTFAPCPKIPGKHPSSPNALCGTASGGSGGAQSGLAAPPGTATSTSFASATSGSASLSFSGSDSEGHPITGSASAQSGGGYTFSGTATFSNGNIAYTISGSADSSGNWTASTSIGVTCSGTISSSLSWSGSCSNNVTASGTAWSNAWSLSLSAPYSTLGVNDSETITATTNQDVGPTPYYIEIYDENTNDLLASCGSGTTCSASVSQSSAESDSYVAYVAEDSSSNPPLDIQATSGTVSVQWVYFSVTLTSTYTTQSPGQSVTLTATSNYDVGSSPYWIEIYNQGTGTLLNACGLGTVCSATASESAPATDTFVSYIGDYASSPPPADQQAESGTVSVQWVTWSVSLYANYTTQQVGDSVELTATANNNLNGSPWVNEIYNSTTGTFVGGCNAGAVCSFSVTESSAANNTFVAYVADYSAYNPPPLIQATSGTITVTWVSSFSVTLSASTTSPSGGGTVTLSASTNIQGNSPYDIEIYNSGSDALLSACSSGSTCTASVSEAGGVTESYIAYVADYSSTAPPPNIQATSNTVSVVWASAIGGFSAGSWDGTPSPASAYHYGIVDAGGGFTGRSADCSYPSDADTSFSGALSALQKDNMPAYGFMFLTSWYWYQHNCSGGSITSAEGWGEAQAQYFDEVLTASGYTGTLNRIFADVETEIGADWQDDTHADNQAVIYGFNQELCNNYNLCSRGIYSGYYSWPLIVGSGDPNVGTAHFWLAAWDPTQSNLNKFEDYFTTSPGGYTISSWQYGTTACTMTYAAAQTEANDASPWIPRFDMWTNSHPNVVC